MRKFTVLSILLVLAVSMAPAVVDDGRTYQCWDFEQEGFWYGMLPSLDQNPYGDAVAIVSDMSVERSGVTWREGAWYGTDIKIILDIPNQPIPRPNDFKILKLNLLYQGDVSFSWVADAVSGVHFTLVDEVFGETNDGWLTLYQEWHFEPNPREEIVVIGLSSPTGALAAIGQICVETWCIPEPATVTILALGAAMTVAWRKRS